MNPIFTPRHPSLTIVTAASSNHFRCLLSLLWTIAKFEPRARVVVWDIGLTTEEHSTLRETPPFQLANWELKIFDFTKYPPHFELRTEAGRMAFRPTILAQRAHELSTLNLGTPQLLLWLDADCQLRAPLDDLQATLKNSPVYSPCIPGTIGTKLHPTARAELKVTIGSLPKPLRDAGMCAFDIANPQVLELIDRWSAVALDKTCTAPGNSTRHTHRQDAVFAVLLNQAAEKNNWKLETKHFPGLINKQDNLTLPETKFRTGALRLGSAALGAVSH